MRKWFHRTALTAKFERLSPGLHTVSRICETGPNGPTAKFQNNRHNMNSTCFSQRISLLRILDAAANRAREGLRVLEDWVRFGLDDPHLTAHLKEIRHDLAASLAGIPLDQRLAARETQADVGTQIGTASESQRNGPNEVLTANFLRLEESLRSLEEYGKIIDPSVGVAIEQLRYRVYTVQRAVDATRRGGNDWQRRGCTFCWTGARRLQSSSGWPFRSSKPGWTFCSFATSDWPTGS